MPRLRMSKTRLIYLLPVDGIDRRLKLADAAPQEFAALAHGNIGVRRLLALAPEEISAAPVHWWFQCFNEHGFQTLLSYQEWSDLIIWLK